MISKELLMVWMWEGLISGNDNRSIYFRKFMGADLSSLHTPIHPPSTHSRRGAPQEIFLQHTTLNKVIATGKIVSKKFLLCGLQHIKHTKMRNLSKVNGAKNKSTGAASLEEAVFNRCSENFRKIPTNTLLVDLFEGFCS